MASGRLLFLALVRASVHVRTHMFAHYICIVMLYYIIDYGMLFQTWECGIRLCKELSTLYEMELFDYHKLAAILVSSISLYTTHK